MRITNPDLPLVVTFMIYIVGMVGIGLVAYRATTGFDDYILGGRRLGAVVTALSAGASDMSGWLLMGLPGAVLVGGIVQAWIAVGLTLGAYLNWRLIAGQLRVQTEVHHNALTLPDYFAARFEDRTHLLRTVSALVILVFFTVYCASGVVAGARLFQNTFGIRYQDALWIGAAATIVYTFIGGFLAISWTDAVQASLLVVALVVTPTIVIEAAGGVAPALAQVAAVQPAALQWHGGWDGVAVLSMLGWGLGYFGQPHILARFMASTSHRTIARARRIGMVWMILCLAGACAVGFFGIAYFAAHPSQRGGVDANSEQVFLELVRLLFNPWLAGVLLSAVLAAIMSTLSCQLLVCASAITEDLYKAFVRPQASQHELVVIGRSMVLLTSLVAIGIAMNPESRVLKLVSYAWAGFGASFGPLILISLWWSRMTRNGAIAGMLAGAATVIAWKYYGWFGLYEIIPGFAAASLAIWAVSWLDRLPPASVQARFADARRAYGDSG